MRLRITHETTITFDTPTLYAVQILRLTPRGSSQLFVNDWRIDISEDCRLSPEEDSFGNWTHSFSVDGPISRLVITASGEVMTEETSGIIRGTPERLPLPVYLRDTAVTRAPPALAAKAAALKAKAKGERLATLHALMGWVHEAIKPQDEEPEVPTVEAILKAEAGSTRDRTHVFLAAARSLDIPARYVSGYVFDPDAETPAGRAHAWAEAHVGGTLGWIGFDPTLNLCPTELHVRVASSLDYLDSQPMRGKSFGGSGETMTSTVTVQEVKSRRHKTA